MLLRITLTLLLFALPSLHAVSHSADLVWVVQGGVRMQQHINPLLIEEGPPQFGQSMTGAGLSLGILAGLQLSERISLSLQVDSGEIYLAKLRRKNGDQFAAFVNDYLMGRAGDQSTLDWLLEESMFLRELYATFWLNKRGWHRLFIGQRQHNIASSAVFDGYALGFFIEADLRKRRYRKRKPLAISLALFLPDSSWTKQGKLSPTAHFSLLFDKRWLQIKFDAAYMYDGGGMTGRMFWPALQTNIPSFQQANISPACQLRSTRCPTMPDSSGHHVWFGTTIMAGRPWSYRGFTLFASAVAYGGVSQIQLNELPDQVGGFGIYLDAGVIWKQGPFRARLDMMYNMGAEQGSGSGGLLLGFRAIAPQLRHQHVMFPGGATAIGSKRTLGLNQLSNGYWGARIFSEYAHRRYDFKLLVGVYGTDFNTSANAAANTPPQDVPRTLDLEANARASVDMGDWLRLFGQFDIYMPGGYIIDNSRPPIVRLWVGIDFTFRSW